MATKETRRERGHRRGRMLVGRTLDELRRVRVGAGVSREQMARELSDIHILVLTPTSTFNSSYPMEFLNRGFLCPLVAQVVKRVLCLIIFLEYILHSIAILKTVSLL